MAMNRRQFIEYNQNKKTVINIFCGDSSYTSHTHVCSSARVKFCDNTMKSKSQVFPPTTCTLIKIISLTAINDMRQSIALLLSRVRQNMLCVVASRARPKLCSCYVNVLCGGQVTRLQYLNALMASRVGQSPDPPEIKILPNSQTKLLNDRNATQGIPARRLLPLTQHSAATC